MSTKKRIPNILQTRTLLYTVHHSPNAMAGNKKVQYVRVELLFPRYGFGKATGNSEGRARYPEVQTNLNSFDDGLVVKAAHSRIKTAVLDGLPQVPPIVELKKKKVTKLWRNAPRRHHAHVQVVTLKVICASDTTIQWRAGRRVFPLLEVKWNAFRISHAVSRDVSSQSLHGLSGVRSEQGLLCLVVDEIAVHVVHHVVPLE